MPNRQSLPLSLAVAFCWFSLYAYLPIFPTYARDLGASYEMIGIMVGGFGITQVLLRLPLGIMSDKLNRRKIFIMIGLVLCVVSSAGMYLLPSVISLLFFRALAGIAATTWVVQTVLYASYCSQNNSAGSLGVINAVCLTGQMLATLAGGAVALYFGDRDVFLLSAVISAAGLLCSYFIDDNRSLQRQPPNVASLLAIGKEPTLMLTSLLALLQQVLTYGTIYGFMPVWAKSIGANSFEMGMLPTLFMLPGIFGSVLSSSWLAEKYGINRAIVGGFVIMAAAEAAVPFIRDISLLYFSQIIAGFGRGFSYPLLMGLSVKYVESAKQATAMGYFQAVYGAGMFIGPLVVGVLGERFGLEWGFWTVSLIGFCGAGVGAIWLSVCQARYALNH